MDSTQIRVAIEILERIAEALEGVNKRLDSFTGRTDNNRQFLRVFDVEPNE